MPRPRTTLRMGGILNLKSEVAERFLRSGTARTAVPPVEVTEGHLASPKRIARVFRIGLTCASARNVLKRRREFVMRKMIVAVVSAALLSRGAYGQNAASGTHSCEDLAQLELLGARSEERRVGKESRAWAALSHQARKR